MNSCPKIGYVPVTSLLTHPSDYRRFVGYAKARGLQFEEASREEKYDLVVLSCQADISVWHDYPYGKVVYDLIDSYLAIPSGNVKGMLRGLAKFAVRQNRHLRINYWDAIRDMCRRSDAVVCTTIMQRKDIRPYCKNAHIVLDNHSEVATVRKKDYAAGEPFKLVWEGLPSNVSQLEVLRDVLRQLSERYPIELHLVTDMEGARFLGKFGKHSSKKAAQKIFDHAILHRWDKETCAKTICSCDAAIIPIDLNNPFVAGKPENKLLLLWRMGMPVVASGTPAYVRAMSEAGLQLTCSDDEEWIERLGMVITDPEFRRNAGESGVRYVSEHFSEAIILDQWDDVFRSIGFEFAKGDFDRSQPNRIS